MCGGGRLRIRRIRNLYGLPNMIGPMITERTESCCFFFYKKAHLIALYNQIILDTLSEVDKATFPIRATEIRTHNFK